MYPERYKKTTKKWNILRDSRIVSFRSRGCDGILSRSTRSKIRNQAKSSPTTIYTINWIVWCTKHTKPVGFQIEFRQALFNLQFHHLWSAASTGLEVDWEVCILIVIESLDLRARLACDSNLIAVLGLPCGSWFKFISLWLQSFDFTCLYYVVATITLNKPDTREITQWK